MICSSSNILHSLGKQLVVRGRSISTTGLVNRCLRRVALSSTLDHARRNHASFLLWPRANETRRHSSMNPNDFIVTSLIDSVTFEAVCSNTLESLCDYFDEVIGETAAFKNADVTYGDGVLTVKFGEPYGTYVINRQSPNRQIWLSSPTSGPKRYDFVPDKRTPNEGYWLYRHDQVTLHELLQREISVIIGSELDFFALPHSQRPKDGREDGS